jgi:hypothetical protein
VSSTIATDAIFRVDGNTIITGPGAAGPWDPTMQHGSAPSSLVTWIAEQVPSAAPMQITRLTVDLLRPVPVAPLTFETEILREGRKIQLVGITLLAAGVVVVRATALRIRIAAPALPDDIVDEPVSVTLPDDSRLLHHNTSRNPFLAGMTMRSAHGDFLQRGPAAIWYRLDRPIIEGQPVSQVMRAVVASDFSNGTSALLDFRTHTYINADLTVSLSRPPVGEWILLDAKSWIGPNGSGLAAAKLADIKGYFGRAIQSLVIEVR